MLVIIIRFCEAEPSCQAYFRTQLPAGDKPGDLTAEQNITGSVTGQPLPALEDPVPPFANSMHQAGTHSDIVIMPVNQIIDNRIVIPCNNGICRFIKNIFHQLMGEEYPGSEVCLPGRVLIEHKLNGIRQDPLEG